MSNHRKRATSAFTYTHLLFKWSLQHLLEQGHIGKVIEADGAMGRVWAKRRQLALDQLRFACRGLNQ